jgi:hypothetical protein
MSRLPTRFVDLPDMRSTSTEYGTGADLLLAAKAPHPFRRIIAISPNCLVNGMMDSILNLFSRIRALFVFTRRFLGAKARKGILRIKMMLKDIVMTDHDPRVIRPLMRILCTEKDMIKEAHIPQLGGLLSGSSIRKFERSNCRAIVFKKRVLDDMRHHLLER